MKPLPNANGDTINWLNYKTGIRHLYFRMDAENQSASVSIEIQHTDLELQEQYFEQLQQLKNILEEETGEEWQWQLHHQDEDGNIISRIITSTEKVNVFNTNDWPEIISFLKPRIMALDRFWNMVKDGFD